jgi:acyl-CoA synthetase (AMP-forming)/AMP-acid ligase II
VTEVIVTGGEKVWPDAVERVLAAHGGVAVGAVWTRPDPEWGERVVAWVVPTERQPGPEELVDLVKTTLAPWAAPREVVFTTALPRTASGKVRRRDLR